MPGTKNEIFALNAFLENQDFKVKDLVNNYKLHVFFA